MLTMQGYRSELRMRWRTPSGEILPAEFIPIAEEVGLQKNDVIIAVNDAKIATTRDLEKATAARASYWKLTIQRGTEVFTSILRG